MEQVLLELGQVAGAEGGGIAHQQRRRRLGVAVLGRVHVQHEGGERPFQPRQRAGEHDEARAGELGRPLEIHEPERLADLEMLLRAALDVRLLAPTPDFDDWRSHRHRRARRHRWQVGKARQQPVELGGERLFLPLQRLGRVLQPRDLGEKVRYILTLGAGGADSLGLPVALPLAILELGLNRAPLRIEFLHLGRMGFHTPPGEACVERGAVLANPPSAEHDGRACNPRKSFVNTSMHEMSPEGELASRGRMRRKWPQH